MLDFIKSLINFNKSSSVSRQHKKSLMNFEAGVIMDGRKIFTRDNSDQPFLTYKRRLITILLENKSKGVKVFDVFFSLTPVCASFV